MAGLTSALATNNSGLPVVELLDITKRFGGVLALDCVTLKVSAGSVHALVGENGAGKSTLGRICGGLLAPDSGAVIVDGAPVHFRSPRDALGHGIATIAQELALVPGLTVEQNVFLGTEPRSSWFLRPRALRQRFTDLARQVGFDLPPTAVTSQLRTADQQKVEIMRALSRGASVIIMDEPTAALPKADTERLYEVIRSLARSGRAVVLVSHFLSEVLSLSDTVTILRDGRHIRTGPSATETESTLIEAMLGHSLGSVFPGKPSPPPAEAPLALSVSGLRAPGVAGIDLRVRAGEIVGLAGLVGAGRTELARAVAGASVLTAGKVHVDGLPRRFRSPTQGLRGGVVMIPESRKEQGLVMQRSVLENLGLATVHRYSHAGLVARRRERAAVLDVLEKVQVRVPALSAPIAALSGGNQQKALFGRALLCAPRVLIADEPTRGVDVGSRRAIYELIGQQARQGVGVLVISSDVEEVLGLSHRVLVMRGGRIVAELEGDQMTEEKVLTAAFSEPSQPSEGAHGG